MVVHIEQKIVVANGFTRGWIPECKTVDGSAYMKLNWKCRRFYKFCTGKAIVLGRPGVKHKLKFWEYLVTARKNASQAAFEKVQVDNMKTAGMKDPSSRKRWRRVKDSDSAVVGDVVDVDLDYNDLHVSVKALFGTSKQEIWIEATTDALDFIGDAMFSDYQNNDYATTHGRGAHFQRHPGHDGHDGSDDASEDDDEGDQAQNDQDASES